MYFAAGCEFELIEPNCFAGSPGRNEITLRLRRAMGMWLSMESDGLRIDAFNALDPASEQFFDLVAVGAATDAASGRGVAMLETMDVVDQAMAFRVPTPGLWRVIVPPLVGYEPVAPFEVTIERGVMLKHAIALRKAR
ncbi:MAG: hypothetical protein EXS13_14220 [Planctomycetes bacterium]|nr:hypothetical protein [Planctomycetota bacterium]